MYNLYLNILYLVYYICIKYFNFFFIVQSAKALAISKLRADITYNHHLHNDSLSTELTIDINNTKQDSDNLNNLENINDLDNNLVLEEEDPDFEESDKEANRS